MARSGDRRSIQLDRITHAWFIHPTTWIWLTMATKIQLTWLMPIQKPTWIFDIWPTTEQGKLTINFFCILDSILLIRNLQLKLNRFVSFQFHRIYRRFARSHLFHLHNSQHPNSSANVRLSSTRVVVRSTKIRSVPQSQFWHFTRILSTSYLFFFLFFFLHKHDSSTVITANKSINS